MVTETQETNTEDRSMMGNPYQAPMHQYGGSIIYLTDPTGEIQKMELALRNKYVDHNGELQSHGQPLMNELGISSIVGQVQSVVNQVTIMSILSKQEIISLIDFLADTICKDMLVNKKKYGIVNVAARDKIFQMALSTAYICMKRAIDIGMNDKKFWQGSQQEITTRVEGGKQKGIFSSVLGWGR